MYVCMYVYVYVCKNKKCIPCFYSVKKHEWYIGRIRNAAEKQVEM